MTPLTGHNPVNPNHRSVVFDDIDAGFKIAEWSDVNYDPLHDSVCASLRGTEVLGGMIYKDFQDGHCCTMHVGSSHPNFCTKEFLWSIFYYPFVLRRCKVVFGTLPSYNLHALKVDLKLGFKEVARVPNGFANGDLVVLAMYKDECRYLDMAMRRKF
ncbi:hypothetical protein UFOVP470_24 [uncultured Caudovirales phage]|uniref:Uncharacterized protein n=1 Tax=uncultured Caudovirales phage TaxID=2100421 RepID=A0A6J5MDF7_9CAUD|nr:hypothetical protein UFOVP470_24 [uncultured Caudovirales phage]